MKAFINSSSYKPSKNSLGFTLIELMVTIAILAIIVSIAAPNISTQLANQRVKSTTATLHNALKEAKVESVIRRQDITLTYNNNNSPKSIVIEGIDGQSIANYNYDAKTTIKSGNAKITFSSNKTANETTYTICDSNTAVSPRQISVSKLGNITNQSAGSCS